MLWRRLTIGLLPVVLLVPLAAYGWYWWSTPPCMLFLRAHRQQLEAFARMLLADPGRTHAASPDIDIPDRLRQGEIGYVQRSDDVVIFTCYRWYTFPDGPMDQVVCELIHRGRGAAAEGGRTQSGLSGEDSRRSVDVPGNRLRRRCPCAGKHGHGPELPCSPPCCTIMQPIPSGRSTCARPDGAVAPGDCPGA